MLDLAIPRLVKVEFAANYIIDSLVASSKIVVFANSYLLSAMILTKARKVSLGAQIYKKQRIFSMKKIFTKNFARSFRAL